MNWIVLSLVTVIVPWLILYLFIYGLFFPRFAVWALFLHVSVLTALVVWVGIVLSLLGWVLPKLSGSEATTPAKEKIISAAIVAVLLYVGKQLLELRQIHFAEKVLRSVLKRCFRKRVPDTLREGNTDDTVERLAYRALYSDDFVVPNRFVVKGWRPKASSLRVQLIKEFIQSRRPHTS